MRLPLGSARDLPKHLPLLGLIAAALVAAFTFEHWVVHLLVVLPAAAEGGAVPPWTIAAMVVPELVVLFFAGYRLRGALAVLMFASVAALLRGGFHLALAVAGEPGHVSAAHVATSELAVTAPVMAIAYLFVLWLAACSAIDDGAPREAGRRARRA